jgi:hypothetical protein
MRFSAGQFLATRHAAPDSGFRSFSGNYEPENNKGRAPGPGLLISNWLRGLDLNQRPPGYEPDELPGCSTPRLNNSGSASQRQIDRRNPDLAKKAPESGGRSR